MANAVQNSFNLHNNINNNNSQVNDNYIKLISTFESKMITESKKKELFAYMERNCEQKFASVMKVFIEDFNLLLSQSVQAIRMLLEEKEKIIKDQKMGEINEYENNNEDNILENKEIIKLIENSKFELRKPLRQQLKQMSMNDKNIQSINDIREQRFHLSPNYKEKYKSNDQLEIIKLTNQILKNIEITIEHKKLFCRKYLPSSSLSINEKYKTFLEKIISYKYNLEKLHLIYNDIMKIKNNNNSISLDFKNSPLNSQISSSCYEANNNFMNGLRKYLTNTQFCNKPFNQFTSPYSRLFSKN